MRTAIAALLAVLLAFAAITWWALEWSEVAVLETRRPDGSIRSTHVWYATHGGELWLEAGTPENGWFLDIQHAPMISIEIAGDRREYRAEPVEAVSGHARIRSLLREKYGARDWWVGQLVDTSRSIAVRLLPPGESGGPSLR